MQNKPNLLDAQMNVSKVLTKDYGNFRLYGRRENKPNQTQFLYQYAQNKPNQTQFQYQYAQNKAKQTQSCPPPADSKGDTLPLCGAVNKNVRQPAIQQ